jgi:hypothetical protein
MCFAPSLFANRDREEVGTCAILSRFRASPCQTHKRQ